MHQGILHLSFGDIVSVFSLQRDKAGVKFIHRIEAMPKNYGLGMNFLGCA
jgi:hypothetical protein